LVAWSLFESPLSSAGCSPVTAGAGGAVLFTSRGGVGAAAVRRVLPAAEGSVGVTAGLPSGRGADTWMVQLPLASAWPLALPAPLTNSCTKEFGSAVPWTCGCLTLVTWSLFERPLSSISCRPVTTGAGAVVLITSGRVIAPEAGPRLP